MNYHVSEIFTDVVQGEGQHAGSPCSFLRFQFCNLWANPEKKSATCPFCDTPQLHKGEDYTFDRLKDELSVVFNLNRNKGLVISGGEPLMQLDSKLVEFVAERFPWIDVETNGTLQLLFTKPKNLFISCSPKVTAMRVTHVDQYKLLIPDKEHLLPIVLERAAFESATVYLQPVEVGGYDSAITKENIRKCMTLCNKYGTSESVSSYTNT